MQQNSLMKFDPATGQEAPYPSHAGQWRQHHGGQAWLFNPWTGTRRLASDVGSDVTGLLIAPPGEHWAVGPKKDRDLQTQAQGQGQAAQNPEDPKTVRLVDLPLGSRFRYVGEGKVFVLLDRCKLGLVAEEPETCPSARLQGLYSAADTPSDLRALRVVPLPPLPLSVNMIGEVLAEQTRATRAAMRAFGADEYPMGRAIGTAAPVVLDDIEQYRMQMAGICSAATGHWKIGDRLHPDYDTPALRQVAELYASYVGLRRMMEPASEPEVSHQQMKPVVLGDRG